MSTKNRGLMDEVHEVMRSGHYSIHTERSCCDRIKRFALFHEMKTRDDLRGGEVKIERFPARLAVEGNVSPSTRDRAMNALVFLYRKIPEQPLDGKIDAVRARKKRNVPVVLAGDEVASVVSPIKGTPRIAVEPLHGGGPGTGEAIRSRVHDIDHDPKENHRAFGERRQGQGRRVSRFPGASAAEPSRNGQNDL